MGFFTDLLGGSGSVQEIGGGFDPAVKPYIEEGLKSLQKEYRKGPRVYEGERVAAFDPAQLQAQEALLGLSTAQPDYYRLAQQGMEEATGLQRRAVSALTPEEIQQQREIYAPAAERERLAAQQAFERSLRDIDIAAGGAGTGAMMGSRADILRGGAAGELAMAEAGLQSQLTERAISGAEAQRAREAAGAAGLATLTGQTLGVGQEGFGEQVQRSALAQQVGAERRGLEQQRIGAEMAKFGEYDPFGYAQQYLSTVYGAPTRSTQYSQDPSTFQEIMGVASFFNQGGTVYKNAGALVGLLETAAAAGAAEAGAAELAASAAEGGGQAAGMPSMGGQSSGGKPSEKLDFGYASGATPAQVMNTFAPKQLAMGGQPDDNGFFGKFKNKVKDAMSNNKFTDNEGISSLYYKGDEDEDKKKDGVKDIGKDVPREENSSRMSQDEMMAAGAPKVFKVDDSVMRAKQRAARQAMGNFNLGGGIASLAKGGQSRYNPQPRPSMPQDEGNGFFDKIMGQVSSGLQSIGSGIVQAKDYYYENIDPFKDITDPAQRKRIGLAILGTQPTLGESPLGTVARAASGALQQQDLMDIEKQKATTTGYLSGSVLSPSLFEAVEGSVLTLAELRNPKVKKESDGLKATANKMAITDPQYTSLYNPKDVATRGVVTLNLYQKLLEEYKGSDKYKKDMNIPVGTPAPAPAGTPAPAPAGATAQSKIKALTSSSP
jgi:hypothetical protein